MGYVKRKMKKKGMGVKLGNLLANFKQIVKNREI